MKSDSLLKKYKKAMKSKAMASDTEKKKIHQNFVSRLFIRIFLSSVILLTFVGVDRIVLKKTGRTFFEKNIQTNWNFLKMANIFNTLFGEFIPKNDDINVDITNAFEHIEYKNGVNVITNQTFSGVTNIASGIVTKIKREKDQTYTIVIQSDNDYVYTYSGLESIDFNIYSYIAKGTIIGLAKNEENCYKFNIKIEKEGVEYSYYENWENKD